MVRIHLGPPHTSAFGALAQLGERLLCKHQVIGSIPIGSTISQETRRGSKAAAHVSKNGQRYGARPQGAASLRLTGSRNAHHQPQPRDEEKRFAVREHGDWVETTRI